MGARGGRARGGGLGYGAVGERYEGVVIGVSGGGGAIEESGFEHGGAW